MSVSSKLQTVNSTELQSIDFSDFVATYRPHTYMMDEATRNMLVQAMEEIAPHTDIVDNVVSVHLDEIELEKQAVIDSIILRPVKTAEFLQRLAQLQQDEQKKYYVAYKGDSDLHKIREENVGKLVTIDAYVEHITEPLSQDVEVAWYCRNEHKTVMRYRRGEQTEKPLNCSEEECNRNPYKKASSREQSLKYGAPYDPMQVMVQQTVLQTGENRIKGEWDKSIIGTVEEGQDVRVNAVLRKQEQENSKTQQYYLHILNVDVKTENGDLSDGEKEEVRQWVDDTDLRERVMSIDEYDDDRYLPRLATLCSVVKGNQENENIHTLLVGNAGTGKTELGQNCIDMADSSTKIDMQKSSEAGIVGTVSKMDMLGGETWTVQHGALARASGGTVLVDELDKVDRAGEINILSESMQSGTASIEKAANKTLETDVSIIGTCNPVTNWGEYETRIDALPDVFSDHIIDRFDIVLWMDKSEQSSEDIASRFLTDGGESNEESEEPVEEWVQYARSINPDLKPDSEAFEQLVEYFDRIESTSNRTEQTIALLSEAVAKMRLHKDVSSEDVETAWRLWTASKRQMWGEEYGEP